MPGRYSGVIQTDVSKQGNAALPPLCAFCAGGGEGGGVACLVDRSEKRPELGVSLWSLLRLPLETFEATALPTDLQNIPASKPGSR